MGVALVPWTSSGGLLVQDVESRGHAAPSGRLDKGSVGGMGSSEVQTRLTRLKPCPHPDCFLVLGICSLLLLLGSMVPLPSTPAVCAVFRGQQMQCMAWQQLLRPAKDLTLYRAKGFESGASSMLWGLPADQAASSSTAQTASTCRACCMYAGCQLPRWLLLELNLWGIL